MAVAAVAVWGEAVDSVEDGWSGLAGGGWGGMMEAFEGSGLSILLGAAAGARAGGTAAKASDDTTCVSGATKLCRWARRGSLFFAAQGKDGAAEPVGERSADASAASTAVKVGFPLTTVLREDSPWVGRGGGASDTAPAAVTTAAPSASDASAADLSLLPNLTVSGRSSSLSVLGLAALLPDLAASGRSSSVSVVSSPLPADKAIDFCRVPSRSSRSSPSSPSSKSTTLRRFPSAPMLAGGRASCTRTGALPALRRPPDPVEVATPPLVPLPAPAFAPAPIPLSSTSSRSSSGRSALSSLLRSDPAMAAFLLGPPLPLGPSSLSSSQTERGGRFLTPVLPPDDNDTGGDAAAKLLPPGLAAVTLPSGGGAGSGRIASHRLGGGGIGAPFLPALGFSGQCK